MDLGAKCRAPALLAVLGVFAASPARADDLKQVCSDAYQEAQAARKEGKLQKAYDKAVVCAQSGCPDFVKADCAQWFTQIEASLPTVVFEARDASGKETAAVRVLVDGAPVLERLDGKALRIDPGEHTLRYEIAGSPSIEEHVLIREAEKNRRIAIQFAKPPAPVPAPTVAPVATTRGGAPTAAYILAGTAVVGVGLFATFGALGRIGKSNLVDTCAPNCKIAQVDAVRAKLIAADVSLGVAIVATGFATYLFIAAPPKTSSARAVTSLDVAATPLAGGAFGALRGRF